MLLHVTKKASGYFDNMWLWVGDHLIDDPLLDDALNNMDQISVYSARGMLIESQKATWLYGTASEHSVYYQYNFNGARNIFTTMLQTESPYFQPTPKPPAPFEKFVNTFVGDPDYSCKGGDNDGCDSSWAVIMRNCQNVHISAAGTYSWFSTYTQDCIDQHSCQMALWMLDNNYDNNRLQHITAIGAKNIIVSPASPAISSDSNLALTSHPAWAHISVYDVPSIGAPPSPVPENMCSKGDRMYNAVPTGDIAENVEKGDIELWSIDGTILNHAEDTDGHQYVTIVNLTPYKMFKAADAKPYQFAAWKWKSVPSGRATKNEATCDLGLSVGKFVDTNGFATYALHSTGKTFQVHVTTHIPDTHERRVIFDLRGMGLGWRELAFPGGMVSVALIITGSEEFGYITSLQLNNMGWMRSMYDVIKDRHVRHVVVPGSHDAGMSRIIDFGWVGAGIPANTQTQSLDHYDQLRVGVRYFDMRIVSINGGDFWTAHVTDETAGAPAGSTGESLDDLIKGVNRFTSEHPGELIIWWVRYMTDLDAKRPEPKYRWWSVSKVNEFYTKLEQINNRCPNLGNDPTFDMRPIKNFMDANQGRGCVLIMTDGRLQDNVPKDNPRAGIYHGSEYLRRDDYWAREQYTQQTADKQIARMKQHVRDNSTSAGVDGNTADKADNLAIMQWQCTPSAGDMMDPPTLRLIANQETNPALYHYGVNDMTPEHFPTVILHDAVGLFLISDTSEAGFNPMMQTLAIGLNLYMVSQNCDVSSIKHPLLKKSNDKLRVSAWSSGNGFKTFRGVIFANGTVLEEVPVGFCGTCTYNDTSSIDHPVMSNQTQNGTWAVAKRLPGL